MTRLQKLTGILALAATAGVHHAAIAAEAPKDVIAAQIRKQGFACTSPKDAKRDEAASKADEAAWILSCENATYRVLLIPNMAAKVETVPEQPK